MLFINYDIHVQIKHRGKTFVYEIIVMSIWFYGINMGLICEMYLLIMNGLGAFQHTLYLPVNINYN